MSNPLECHALSLENIFDITEVSVFNFEGGVILIADFSGESRLLHIYENECEGMTMYGLNLGRKISMDSKPLFSGKIKTIEIYCFIDKINWNFCSMSIENNESKMRIERNDASFPEPTFQAVE